MAAVEKIRVGICDIKLGEPLPYSVYDKDGVLLLKAGTSINMERQLQRLVEEGLFHHPNETAPVDRSRRDDDEANTFLILDTAKQRLQRLFEHYKLGRGLDDFVKRIEDIAISVQESCSHDIDAALANLHLDYDTSYAVVHGMQAALLCEITGKHLGVKEDMRLTLIKAALTHDIGLLDIQDLLDQQVEMLSAGQKQRVDEHPNDSAEQLIKLGVTDPIWLDAVRHHHERLDGSGYPDHLADKDIKTPTRVLSVADIYSAMIRDRPYRKAMVSQDAMRQLLLEQGSKTDQRLIQMMIKDVGVFPPGAIVQLQSKEVAVVKSRQANSLQPLTFAFIKADGTPMLAPMPRNTATPGLGISGILPFSNYRSSVSLIRKLWVKN